jgi:hypothetical protein
MENFNQISKIYLLERKTQEILPCKIIINNYIINEKYTTDDSSAIEMQNEFNLTLTESSCPFEQ